MAAWRQRSQRQLSHQYLMKTIMKIGSESGGESINIENSKAKMKMAQWHVNEA